MKKLFTLMFTALFIAFSASFLYAAEENTEVETTAETETPQKYDIFVREGCPHCAQVKRWVTQNNLQDNVNYIETLNNTQNQKKLEEMFKKYDAPANEQGVPFMVVSDSEYRVGDRPIIEYLADQFDIEVTEAEYQTSTSDTIFLIIGGLLMAGVFGYGLYSTFAKKK